MTPTDKDTFRVANILPDQPYPELYRGVSLIARFTGAAARKLLCLGQRIPNPGGPYICEERS